MRKCKRGKHLILFKRAFNNGRTINFHPSSLSVLKVFFAFFSTSYFTLYIKGSFKHHHQALWHVGWEERKNIIFSLSEQKRVRRKEAKCMLKKSCIFRVSRFIPLLHFMEISFSFHLWFCSSILLERRNSSEKVRNFSHSLSDVMSWIVPKKERDNSLKKTDISLDHHRTAFSLFPR